MSAVKMTKKQAKKRTEKQQWFDFNKAVILLILLAVIVIFRTTLAPTQTPELSKEKKNDLAGEANIILGELTGGNAEVSLLDSNELMEEKVIGLEQMNYDELKDLLGVENDFCVFFEDATGDIMKVNDMETGIGSDKIYINGKPCK
tara:strand:+ start:85 stop:522 length:438 start_codon:yes stop_codon:yes gene_type:complete